jgi:hypothetical protein
MNRIADLNVTDINASRYASGLAAQSHRSDHSATAWLVTPTLLQPQDGALVSQEDAPAQVEEHFIFGRLRNMQEPEDAALTGGTRSLLRRAMGLNLSFRGVSRTGVMRAIDAVKTIKASGTANSASAKPTFV